MNFNHNDRVTCKIDGTEITDARISINKNGRTYICQNERNGGIANDKLGYKYSWSLSSDFTDYFVTNLKLATPTWDTLAWKDILVHVNGCKVLVLDVRNDLVDISRRDDYEKSGGSYTKNELRKYGYTLKDPKELLTVAEAEMRLGVKIKTD